MSGLLTTLLAALLGALIDQLVRWVNRQKRQKKAVALAQLRHRLAIERINNQIDQDIADETDLMVLIDRL